MSTNNCPPTQHTGVEQLSNKFDKISGKAVAIGVSILIGLFSMMYSDMKSRVDSLETQASFLYQDKLSRSEFKAELRDLKNDMLISKKDTDAKIDNMRQDVLDRINMLIEYNKSNQQ